MTDTNIIRVDVGGTTLFGERRGGRGPTVVLLHAGVTDRRSWRGVVGELDDDLDVVTYDRRGFGETPPSSTRFSHVDDLVAVIERVGRHPVWLVGSSMGGGVALDAALVIPDRIAGLVLIAPAVNNAPPPELDANTARLDGLITQAADAGNLDEANRLETWLWLDGPAQVEGRVAGPARSLLREMNAIILRNAVPERAGENGLDTWNRLADVRCPVTVACGAFDVPCLMDRSRALAARLPKSRHHVMPGTAHLPQLECPALVADVVRNAMETRFA